MSTRSSTNTCSARVVGAGGTRTPLLIGFSTRRSWTTACGEGTRQTLAYSYSVRNIEILLTCRHACAIVGGGRRGPAGRGSTMALHGLADMTLGVRDVPIENPVIAQPEVPQ